MPVSHFPFLSLSKRCVYRNKERNEERRKRKGDEKRKARKTYTATRDKNGIRSLAKNEDSREDRGRCDRVLCAVEEGGEKQNESVGMRETNSGTNKERWTVGRDPADRESGRS
jgi:hypothetical protein